MQHWIMQGPEPGGPERASTETEQCFDLAYRPAGERVGSNRLLRGKKDVAPPVQSVRY